MEDRILPVAGQLFIDKEKNLVQFIAIAIYKNMESEIAVYQALSGDYKIYAMPLADFKKEMQPFSPQHEKITSMEEVIKIEEPAYQRTKETVFKTTGGEALKSNDETDYKDNNKTDESETINPVLLAFLEADTYEEKLSILTGSRKNLDDRILNHMAISVDCIVSDGDMEEKISSLIYCLKTLARFENKRLR